MNSNQQGKESNSRSIKTICVFCGSSSGARPEYAEAARQLGSLMASSSISLVYGGGRVGLMGVLADAVLESGGQVAGVIPRALVEREIAHTRLTQLHVVETMHERKALMADLADAFIMMPGGFGSWDEFCEIVTWSQLGIHQKPMGILNVLGYYDSFISMTVRAVSDGFVRASHNEMMIVESDPASLLSRLAVATVSAEVKWITGSER